MKLEHRDITLRIPDSALSSLNADEIKDITVRFKYSVDKMYKECGDNIHANLMMLHTEGGNTWTNVLNYLRGLQLEAL